MEDKVAIPFKDYLCICVSTCYFVSDVIPPLLRLGLIDRTSCPILGAVIGIVVACRSIRSNSHKPYDTTELTPDL